MAVIIGYLARVVFLVNLVELLKKIRDDEETTLNTWVAVGSLVASLMFYAPPLFR